MMTPTTADREAFRKTLGNYFILFGAFYLPKVRVAFAVFFFFALSSCVL